MDHRIDSLAALEALYGKPVAAASVKVSGVLTDQYRALIAASPFCALATSGTEGLDCSPRGDAPGNALVRILDDRTLMLPDRRGNNRIDSLCNIVRDTRVALLFLIPGSGTTPRLNGTASLSADPQLLQSFAVEGQAPRSVIIITLGEIYFQCARAVVRADLWNPARHVDPATLPSPGAILAAQSASEVGGEPYDRAWPARAASTMW